MFLHHLAVFNSVALSSLGFVLPDSSTWSSFVGFKIHSFQFEVDRSFSTLFPGFVAATPSTVVSFRRFSSHVDSLSCSGSWCAQFPFLGFSTLISFEKSSTSFPYIPRSRLGRGLVAEILVSFLSYRFVFLETFSFVDS